MPAENGEGGRSLQGGGSQHGTSSEVGQSHIKKSRISSHGGRRTTSGRSNRLFSRRGSSTGIGHDGDGDPMDSVLRRDAFLSGPLHGRSSVDENAGVDSGSFKFSFSEMGDFNDEDGEVEGVMRKLNSLQLRQAASLTSMPEEEEMARFAEYTKSHPALTNTSGKFKHCFMRTLYPNSFVDQPGVVLQAKAVACTTGGELIIAGGSLQLPAEKHNKGWVAVWEKGSDESWRQWDTGLDEIEHPVNDLAVLGNMLVVGHSYPPVIPDGGASFNRNVSIAGSFAGQEKELGEITLWHISGTNAELHPCDVHGIDFYTCDISGVTAVRWLHNPLAPSDSNPPNGCIVASATVRGIISLYRYSQQDRSLFYWTEFSEPRTQDLAEHSKISDLSFLNRMGSEDEDMLLACAYCNQKTVQIWKFDPENENEEQLKPHSKLLHSREVQSARFRKTLGTSSKGDADVLLTAAMDYSLRMWDIDNNRVIRILQNNASHFTSCAFSFQGHLMAAGCQSGELLVYDTHTGLKMRTMLGHTDEINKVMLLPGTDGGMLASASNDGSVRVWELKSKENSILGLGQNDSESKLSTVYSLAFGLNSSRVVTVHRDASMRSWSTRTGELLDSSTDHCKFIFGIDIHPSEHMAATAAHDGTVKLWDLDLGLCLTTFENNDGQLQLPGEAKDREMSAVSFHPSGTWLIAGCFDRRVYLYTRESNGNWRTRCCWHSHLSRVWAVAFSNDGLWMASGAWDTTVKVYRVSDIELPFEAPNRSADAPKTVPEIRTQHVSLNCGANVWAVVFKPQDEHYSFDCSSVLATGSADSILRLWTYSEEDKGGEWQLTCTLKGHSNTVTDIAWHPTGDMLVSSSFDKTVRLWGKSKSGFAGFGVWASYASPTMAVGWGYQDPKAMDSRGSMIAIATMQGVTYLMDATDAGQPFVPFSRAQHILENAGAGATAAIGDIFSQTPQTLTSLGPRNSGIFLLWGIINKFQDKVMLPLLLDSAQNYHVSPLLPYSPQNVAVLTLPNYQLVAAIVDTIISMHEAGDTLGVELLSTGYGTLSILQLIKNFPDQAVVMLNHFGMTACEDDVYDPNWNPHQVLVDGVRACLSKDPTITQTRVPMRLWQEDERKKGIPLPAWGMGQSTVHTVAAHATFPHITGMPLTEWHKGSGPFSADSKKGIKKEGKKTLCFDELESSFLHVAYNSQDPLLFDTALGRAILAYKWNAYGRTYFSLNFAVFLLQLAANMWQAISWGAAYRAGGCAIDDGECQQCPLFPLNAEFFNDPLEVVTCECLPVDTQCGRLAGTRYWSGSFVLFIASMQVLMEIYQMIVLGKRYHRKFMRSSWNGYEVMLIFILTASGVVSIIPHPPPQVVPAITSLAAFLSCFKILYFARAFSSTGGLVRLVAEIVYDMRFMFLIVFIGIFSATISFWALPQHEYFGDDSLDGHLDDLWDMCFFVFSIMMSAYEVGYFTHWLSKVYVFCFVIIQAVLLLNALIALMGNTTEKIKENIKVVALHERAGMMLEMELVLGKSFMQRQEQRPRWLHALVQDKDVEGGNAKDKGGGLCAAPASGVSRQEFYEMQEKMSQMMAVQEHMMQKLDMAISKHSYDSKNSPIVAMGSLGTRRHTQSAPQPVAVMRRTSSSEKTSSRERIERQKKDLKKAELNKLEQTRNSGSDPAEVSSSPRGHRLSEHAEEDAPAAQAAAARGVWSRLRQAPRHTAGVLQSRAPPAGPRALPVTASAPSFGGAPARPPLSPPKDGAPRSIADRIRHKS